MIRGLAKVIREVEALPNFRYWEISRFARNVFAGGHHEGKIGIDKAEETYGHVLFKKSGINEVAALQGALDAAREWLRKEEGRDASI